MNISKTVKKIAPSATLAINAKAAALRAEGKKIIAFGAGEPDFNTPDFIARGAKEAIDKGYTKYTASGGIRELRQAVADKLLTDNALTYDPSQIVVTNGAKQALFNVLQVILDRGDEVIIPAPYWLSYPEMTRLAGGKAVCVNTSERTGFKLTPELLKKSITPKTRAVLINTPGNPTGTVYGKDELAALAEVLKGTEIYVISDEIYEKLIYGKPHYSFAALSDDAYGRTVTVNGFSKTYAMTGWRVGYLAAPPEVAKAAESVQSHETSNVSTPAQYAALAALTRPEGKAFLDNLVKTFDERRRVMTEAMRKMKGVQFENPEGAFYVLLNVNKLIGKTCRDTVIVNAERLCSLLLDNAGVAAVPGAAFGAPKHIRFSYATDVKNIEEGMDKTALLLSGVK